MPPERDAAYLWDIVDTARAVQGFVIDLNLEVYKKQRVIQMAVERGLEIIGEAVRCLSDEFKTAHPAVPWRSIIAQRNVLAHEYDEINQERIWRAATYDIPDLLAKLEPLLSELPPEEEVTP